MQQTGLAAALLMGSTRFAVSFAMYQTVLISTRDSLSLGTPLPMRRTPVHAVNGESVAHSLVPVPWAACA